MPADSQQQQVAGTLVARIVEALEPAADPARAAAERRYLKSDLSS